MASARWYSAFSLVYDLLIERTYRGYREKLVDAIRPGLGARIVDLACGTGQNFPHLLRADPGAKLVGVDASPGMLRRAERRVEQAGWPNVDLVLGDARTVDLADLEHLQPDCAVCALGLSAMPDWERVFRRFFAVLAPGGQFLIFDVYAERRVPQTWWTEWIARADLSRRVWQPLEQVSVDFELSFLPGSPHLHGGRPFLASGFKPAMPRA